MKTIRLTQYISGREDIPLFLFLSQISSFKAMSDNLGSYTLVVMSNGDAHAVREEAEWLNEFINNMP